MTKLAIIYYSATGHGTAMAQRVAAAAESAGAEIRLRHVAETHDPESFAHNPAWTANYEATKDLPTATAEDIVWADAVIFGSPTRFGSVASQLRAFLDSLGGLVFSQRVLLALTQKGMSREDAYAAVQRNAMEAWRGNASFLALSRADKEIRQFLSDD